MVIAVEEESRETQLRPNNACTGRLVGPAEKENLSKPLGG
jgi:hypothetical protein